MLRNLLVDLEFSVGLLLRFATLSHEHFPSADVIHGLIFVSEEIALHQRTVTHCYAAPAGLKGALSSDVSQSNLRCGILSILFVCCGNSSSDTLAAYLVSLRPVGELGRLDDHSSEKFTESIKQVALRFSLLDSVAILWEGSL